MSSWRSSNTLLIRKLLKANIFSFKVNEGQELCVIEAMKMQNSLISTSSGKVAQVSCKVGETVDGDQVLVQLE